MITILPLFPFQGINPGLWTLVFTVFGSWKAAKQRSARRPITAPAVPPLHHSGDQGLVPRRLWFQVVCRG